ncbi:MAG: response regulator transcription factor [Rhodobiaceae bacterium]|jgi:DNA-binding response OmpR family regulator|nr:response regulator transcription factor [Rhodobiaceae bacterium]MDG2496311.1 response regulator transcription factor [Alphaproteobacteria bacterium]
MSAAQRILLVEDDDALAETLAEQLALHSEFSLTRAETAKQALEVTGSSRFDLILLDVGLPDQDGRETCKILRTKGIATPIIMLTGAATDADTILGLDAGANDYITKPFRFGILLARMRAHLRSQQNSETAVLAIGPYDLRPAVKVLEMRAGGDKIRLTEKETNILKFLHRAGGAAVPREVLLHEVWGYNAQVSTHTLETHIYRLRQKIEADPSDAQILQTVEGGYCLQL